MFYSILQHRDRDQDRQNNADADTEAARREADSFSFGLKQKLTDPRGGAMQITEPGRYRLNKDFTVRGSISVGTLPAGTEITITQINASAHQVIGPELGDWHHWEIPAVHLA